MVAHSPPSDGLSDRLATVVKDYMAEREADRQPVPSAEEIGEQVGLHAAKHVAAAIDAAISKLQEAVMKDTSALREQILSNANLAYEFYTGFGIAPKLSVFVSGSGKDVSAAVVGTRITTLKEGLMFGGGRDNHPRVLFEFIRRQSAATETLALLALYEATKAAVSNAEKLYANGESFNDWEDLVKNC